MPTSQFSRAATQTTRGLISTHTVLRNTYLLLSMTLLFSAFTAFFAMQLNWQFNIFTVIIGYFGLLFLTQALRNSVWGIASCFAFTGFLGATLGPILNIYLHTFTNGSELIMTSLGATGLVFFALSGYVLTTRKDFTFLGGFLFAAFTIAFVASLASLFFNLPMLHLAISGAFALLSCAYILFTTSAIIQGGETNYIMATVALFVAIFNLFVSLLRILSFFAGNRE